ncbi:NAD(P)/FAD-dependent oxidoreductase [Alteromonas gilva]|uniref:FAD-binding oxidoreductase n=1 Tax=Alteromonas gilva TaxID=2987522 RepID=A0ABT5KZQ4_9ALTE|nr:FAD-binding oxidoreductase [Alteromonas gilva]MDC8830255.1 FAD-binding oxidoreductase [Alteromonas gilva]
MTKMLETIHTSKQMPKSTTVVVIGGGIVGVAAALTLAERDIPVVLIEKDQIGCEQSSRNLGWIRKTSRYAKDIPLALAADSIWASMPERIDSPVGYRREGIMFLAKDEAQLGLYDEWLKSVAGFKLGSRLLSTAEIDQRVPGGNKKWAGAVYTGSDGYAEPAVATTAMARAAMKKGAVVLQNTAVRTLVTRAGKVTGVVTENGSIDCDQVILAGGAGSRRFLGNMGIKLSTLPLICSVVRTSAIDGPTLSAVGGPDFSFRKHQDGGYIITQRGALKAPLTLDHLLLGYQYLDQLKNQRNFLRIALDRTFIEDLKLARRWSSTSVSPFEKVRVNNPATVTELNQEAMQNLRAAWPAFNQAQIAEAWAGLIDVTPDSNPVIDNIDALPGLTVATGFSGHGFGTGPAAGQLAADLATNASPLVDPSPYRFDRF